MNRFAIGRRIESYREKLKMSTQELADRIQRSQATISRIENGKQGLTFELLARIAAELRVHPFALLSDEPLRYSMLLPANEKTNGSYTPTLLANALYGGRVRRQLSVDAAASLLKIQVGELESVELALSSPDDGLITGMCQLYGLPVQEVLALKRFGQDAPYASRGLTCLQQVLSHVQQAVNKVAPGEEAATLTRIRTLLSSSDAEKRIVVEGQNSDIGLFVNRLSLHLMEALKDKDFRDSLVNLAGVVDRSSENPQAGI